MSIPRPVKKSLMWFEDPADASVDQPMQGWLQRVVGNGQKEREVPLRSVLASERTALSCWFSG